MTRAKTHNIRHITMLTQIKYLFKLLLVFLISVSCVGETNNITYHDLTFKDASITKLEDQYYLDLVRNNKINARITGQNLLDLDNFNNISRVRTYTTIKISF